MTLKRLQVLDALYLFEVKRALSEMSPDEIRLLWEELEPYKIGVAARAGTSRAGMKWAQLLRKLLIVEKAAELIRSEAFTEWLSDVGQRMDDLCAREEGD